MANNGVHFDVSNAEAEQRVIWAFMFADDLLRNAMAPRRVSRTAPQKLSERDG